MICAVIVFFEYTRPSVTVIGRPVGADWSVGFHTPPPGKGISTASSRKTRLGDMPCSRAAPYTNGLNTEPGCRCARVTWSYWSVWKSRLPTQAFTPPVRGSIATKPVCSRVFSARSRAMKSASFFNCASAVSGAIPDSIAVR